MFFTKLKHTLLTNHIYSQPYFLYMIINHIIECGVKIRVSLEKALTQFQLWLTNNNKIFVFLFLCLFFFLRKLVCFHFSCSQPHYSTVSAKVPILLKNFLYIHSMYKKVLKYIHLPWSSFKMYNFLLDKVGLMIQFFFVYL